MNTNQMIVILAWITGQLSLSLWLAELNLSVWMFCQDYSNCSEMLPCSKLLGCSTFF